MDNPHDAEIPALVVSSLGGCLRYKVLEAVGEAEQVPELCPQLAYRLDPQVSGAVSDGARRVEDVQMALLSVEDGHAPMAVLDINWHYEPSPSPKPGTHRGDECSGDIDVARGTRWLVRL